MKDEIELLANLLDYPTRDSRDVVTHAHQIVKKSTRLSLEEKRLLYDFITMYAYTELEIWQQAYREAFGLADASLYLYEHIYPTTYQRQRALENLAATYAEHDLEITSGELPDFLPVFLEFVSTLDEDYEALSYLADIAPVVERINQALSHQEGGYALLTHVILSLARRGVAHPTFGLATA